MKKSSRYKSNLKKILVLVALVLISVSVVSFLPSCKKATSDLTFELSSDGYTYSVAKYKGDSKKIVIPTTHNDRPVTEVSNAAFYQTDITSVYIPGSIATIEPRAFEGCKSLKKVTICEGVSTVGNGSFSSCTSLTEISIPDSVTTLGSSVFMDDSALISVKLGSKVDCIGGSAFFGCTSLESINIPGNTVTYLGKYAFEDCSSLKSITITGLIESIGEKAFVGCTSLESVKFIYTSGWSVKKSGGSSRSISASDLEDQATAAKYLTSTYAEYEWTRS